MISNAQDVLRHHVCGFSEDQERTRLSPLLSRWKFKLPLKLAPVGQQPASVRWCKGPVHASVPRFVPHIPPSLASRLRAPPPSLGPPPPIGPRASESRATPVPGADGPSRLRAPMLSESMLEPVSRRRFLDLDSRRRRRCRRTDHPGHPSYPSPRWNQSREDHASPCTGPVRWPTRIRQVHPAASYRPTVRRREGPACAAIATCLEEPQ